MKKITKLLGILTVAVIGGFMALTASYIILYGVLVITDKVVH